MIYLFIYLCTYCVFMYGLSTSVLLEPQRVAPPLVDDSVPVRQGLAGWDYVGVCRFSSFASHFDLRGQAETNEIFVVGQISCRHCCRGW